MARIYQYHPSIKHADAIGYSMRKLNSEICAMGHEGHLVCQDEDIQADDGTLTSLSEFFSVQHPPGDALIVHSSFYDANLTRLSMLPLRKVLVYHNITPGDYFREVGQNDLANACDAARVQVRAAVPKFEVLIGDSEFNCAELRQFGALEPHVVPVFFNDELFSSAELDVQLFTKLTSYRRPAILFVGRAVPNKRIERLIHILARYKDLYGEELTLHLVGKIWDEKYYARLMRAAAKIGVLRCIKFHAEIDTLQLKTLMRAVDAFVTMSDHEGFMVPIVESFAAGCPVVALRETAVTETMGDAGIGLDDPDPGVAAACIRALRQDRALRNAIIREQALRVAHFRSDRTKAKWQGILQSLLANV